MAVFGCDSSKKSNREKEVFRYNEHKNISGLDPAFAKDNADIWAVHQLFNGLVQMDNNMNIMPCIASSWAISNDGTLYTFQLRKDVLFHPHKQFGVGKTRAVTAEDFVYSFQRLSDTKVASPGSWVLSAVQNYKALNKSTFQIELKYPFPAFLGMLSMKYFSVVPKEIVDFYGTSFRANPIGTGPFKFKRWSENNKLVFRRNPQYFEVDKNGNKLPYLEAIAITFLPDKQSEYLQFVQGNLDFVSGLDASYKDDILTPKGELNPKYSSRVQMLRSPYLNTEYLGFFMPSETSEIESKRIRQAINYGFDREKMMLYLRNGIGIPAHGGFIPKGLPGHDAVVGYTFQPEKAKALIEDYKALSNNSEPTITITTNENYLNFCEFIQRALLDVGLNVTIEVVPASTLKTTKANGKLDVFRASWVADYPDAENYLSLFYSENFTPNGPNYTHFKNDAFDQLYRRSLSESDTKTRLELYKKMDQIVTEEAPVVVLFYDEVVRFVQKNIEGLGINPTNLLELKNVQKN
ncbi:MAG: ABC transporter substrate-binding protein [Bacteroidetes bacterium]|nr:ABC transporter substrate-binding protein [Bacteroidota bacterium]